MSLPSTIPEGIGLSDIAINFVESLPMTATTEIEGGGAVLRWLEHVESNAPVHFATENGDPILIGDQNHYLAGWPDDEFWGRIVAYFAEQIELPIQDLPPALRIRDTVEARFVFNYGAKALIWQGYEIEPAGVLRISKLQS